MFCPASPGGRLAERWRRVLEEVRRSSGGLVRGTVVEQGGLPISALLVDPQPGEQDLCGKQDCNPCEAGTTRRMSCHRQTLGGMVYYCYCKTCKEMVHPQGVEETNSFYHGRCARCLYTRQKEHTAGLAAEKEENPLWKHKELHHQDEEPEFVFTAEKFFKDTLSHQL